MLRQVARAVRQEAFARTGGRRLARLVGDEGLTRLNIGCQGNVIPGWINGDIGYARGGVFLDATKPWPIADGALDAILCEHMIEHVDKAAGARLLAEARRTLRPGGVIRLVTPDVERFARMSLDPDGADASAYTGFLTERHGATSVCDAVNLIFHGYGHRYLYSPAELTRMLRAAGFEAIVATEAGAPDDVVFAGIEGHPKLVGHRINRIEAFALEARTPAGPQ